MPFALHACDSCYMAAHLSLLITGYPQEQLAEAAEEINTIRKMSAEASQAVASAANAELQAAKAQCVPSGGMPQLLESSGLPVLDSNIHG